MENNEIHTQEISMTENYKKLSPKDKMMVKMLIIFGICLPILGALWSLIYYAPK